MTQINSPKTRDVLLCSGTEAQDFLANLLACPLPKPAQCCYGLLLNSKGRIAWDFFVWCYDLQHYLLDCCSQEATQIAKNFAEYAMGREVKLSLTERLSVEVSPQQNMAQGAWSIPDPRTEQMGWRTILQDTLPVQDPDYTLRRLALALPEGGHDLPRGEALPLEYSLEQIGAIALNKGCYLGQEVSTRMARLQTSKYAVQYFQADAAFDPQLPLYTDQEQKVGKWVSCYRQSGFARVQKSVLSHPTLIAHTDAGTVSLKAVHPAWRTPVA